MPNHKFWDQEKLNMAAAAKTHKQRRQVAAYLGTSPGAVAYQGGRERVRRGEYPPQHRWTPEEDAELLEASTGHAKVLARRWGIDEKKVLRHRLEVRRRGGRSVAHHRWTREDLETLRSFPTGKEAMEWARKRGISVNTARQRYYTGPPVEGRTDARRTGEEES